MPLRSETRVTVDEEVSQIESTKLDAPVPEVERQRRVDRAIDGLVLHHIALRPLRIDRLGESLQSAPRGVGDWRAIHSFAGGEHLA